MRPDGGPLVEAPVGDAGAADDLHLRPAGGSSVLFDVAYEPWPTRLASRWSADGGIVFNGLDMLVEQALGQVRLFSGRAQDEPVPDAEHDAWAWWPADVDRWPAEADERLKLMGRFLAAG